MHVFDIYNNEIAYYKTPKCGSRTILAWAALIKEPNLIRDYPTWFEESRQYIEYWEIRKKINDYNIPTHDQKIRFCVVRDPVDRFISSFTNRILFHKKPYTDLSIAEFINNYERLINSKPYIDAKIHFDPQVSHLGKNKKLFTHIYNVKDMHKVKSLLEEYTKVRLPDLYLQKSKNVVKPTLTEKQIKWVKELYKIDYEIYGEWLK